MKSKLLKPYYTNSNIPKAIKKGKTLLVDEIFYSIQTEGPYAGRPATFIRLFGCHLDCSFCDTPQKRKPMKMKVKEIVAYVARNAASNFIVLTGGEPYLYNLQPLTDALIAEAFDIQVETSGSVTPKGLLAGSIMNVISPKTKKLDEHIVKRAIAFKYVVSNKNTNYKTGLPKGLYVPEGDLKGRIMISPMFTDDKKETQENIELAVSTCKAFGYWFTLQYHKLIGIE